MNVLSYSAHKIWLPKQGIASARLANILLPLVFYSNLKTLMFCPALHSLSWYHFLHHTPLWPPPILPLGLDSDLWCEKSQHPGVRQEESPSVMGLNVLPTHTVERVPVEVCMGPQMQRTERQTLQKQRPSVFRHILGEGLCQWWPPARFTHTNKNAHANLCLWVPFSLDVLLPSHTGPWSSHYTDE